MAIWMNILLANTVVSGVCNLYKTLCLCLLSGARSSDMALTNETRPVGEVTKLKLWQFYWEQSDFFLPLSTTEYNGNCQDQYSCSCQDTMKFESYTGYIRLMSKTNCPVKLHVSLTTKGTYRGTLRGLRLHCLRECLNLSGTGGYSAPEAMGSNLKNLGEMPLKEARPGQLHVFL